MVQFLFFFQFVGFSGMIVPTSFKYENLPSLLCMTPKNNFESHSHDQIESLENMPGIEEQLLDFCFEQVIEKTAHRIDEGALGVVVSIDLNEIPRDILEKVMPEVVTEHDAESVPGRHVAKILKVYVHADAQREASLQRRAYELFQETSADIQEHVSIPRINFAKDVSVLHDTTIEKLQELGVKMPTAGAKIGMIMMERVEGVSLRVWAYQQFLNASRDEFAKQYPNIDIEQYLQPHIGEQVLRSLVSRIVGSDDEEIIDMQLQQRLAYRGLMDPIKIKSLRATLKTLHDHGFFHRDIHLKNIMVGDDGRLHLIDFDRSIEIDPLTINVKDPHQVANEIYRRVGDRHFRSDSWIDGFLSAVATTPEQGPEFQLLQEAERIVEQITRLIASDRRPDFSQAWRDLRVQIDQNDSIMGAVKKFLTKIKQDGDSSWLAGVMLALAEIGYDHDVVSACYEVIEKDSMPVAAVNKLRAILLRINPDIMNTVS